MSVDVGCIELMRVSQVMQGAYVDSYESHGSGCQQLTVCSGILQLLAKTLPSVSTVFLSGACGLAVVQFLKDASSSGEATAPR